MRFFGQEFGSPNEILQQERQSKPSADELYKKLFPEEISAADLITYQSKLLDRYTQAANGDTREGLEQLLADVNSLLFRVEQNSELPTGSDFTVETLLEYLEDTRVYLGLRSRLYYMEEMKSVE